MLPSGMDLLLRSHTVSHVTRPSFCPPNIPLAHNLGYMLMPMLAALQILRIATLQRMHFYAHTSTTPALGKYRPPSTILNYVCCTLLKLAFTLVHERRLHC